ncbi:hypothetical protein AAH991_39780 [Microbispora sp. ZYX-F-249]|uniref:Uncharacterized protein n=1 Tax=Microbispora maris TaxID=3144104 RepID=A0ABV0B5R0_9ACTN
MRDALLILLAVLAASAAGLWAWHRYHFRSFWLIVGFGMLNGV